MFNIKTKKNKTISSSRGSDERDKILDNISSAADNGIDDFEEVQEMFCAESDDDDDNNDTVEPPNTPPLSPSSHSLHEYDKSQLDDSVSSTSISTSGDYNTIKNTMTEKQKIRSARIRQKEKERSEVLNDIRDQKEDRKRSSDMKEMMMMMMMQQQQQFQQQQQQFQQQQQQQQMMNNLIMMKMFNINTNDITNQFSQSQPTQNQNSSNDQL